jgi:hypothetical protein
MTRVGRWLPEVVGIDVAVGQWPELLVEKFVFSETNGKEGRGGRKSKSAALHQGQRP